MYMFLVLMVAAVPEAQADSDSGEFRAGTKLWFGLPGHLDNENNAEEIAALFGAPTPELKKILEHATVMEIRCSSLKQGAFSDDETLTAVLNGLSAYNIRLVVRVSVLGRADTTGFRHDLDALQRIEQKGYRIDGIICESVLSSAKERTGLDKGEQVAERSNFVADAIARIQDALGHELMVYIGDTSLAQGQKSKPQKPKRKKPKQAARYDFDRDTSELVAINAKRGIRVAGFIEAFNASRMSKGAAEIRAAVEHLHSLKCEAGIVPINDETDPARYQALLEEQVKVILGAAHALDWISSSTWNRPDAVPTLEQHFKNTAAIIDAMK